METSQSKQKIRTEPNGLAATSPASVHSNGPGHSSKDADPGVTLSQAAPALFDLYSVLSLVLGGCCANVLEYEQLLKMNPRIGSTLTFSQMLFITLLSLPSFLLFSYDSSRRWSWPRLKPRQVPLAQWAGQVLVLTTGSLLNNWAFAFNVPLTVQIVFRSAGLAVSMLFGHFLLKKRYSILQVASVALVSIGVVFATLSKTPSGGNTSSFTTHSPHYQYALGISMLVVSLFLTGVLGMLQELTYQRYGPCWKEGVFYTHCLSLPVFLFLIPDIKQGFASLSNTSSPKSYYLLSYPYLILATNLVSQLICVSGVNRLTSQVSSVSTNLVLTTRKVLSLCFSVWWFGNGWNWELGTGASMVFFGSFLFTLGAQPKGKPSKKDRMNKED